jgi:hypothetical protein
LFELEFEIFGLEGFEHIANLTEHEAWQAVLGAAVSIPPQ